MRLLRVGIVGLIVFAAIAPPAPAQFGSGCPFDCYQLLYNGTPIDSFCASAENGQYLTCRKIQMCYKDPYAGTYCDAPTCTGDTCMYI